MNRKRIAAKVQAFGLAWTLTSAIHPTRDNERVYKCVTPPPSFRACVEERDGQIYTDRACAAELVASRSHAFSIRAREKGLVHCLRATCSLLQEFLQDQSDCRIVPRHVYPPTQYAERCGFSKISTYRHASLLALALCRYLVGQQNNAKLLTYDRSTYGRQRRSLLPWMWGEFGG